MVNAHSNCAPATPSRTCPRYGLVLALVAAIGISLAGCGSADKIESYQVDKPEVLTQKYFHDSATETTDRMLAAIVPRGSQFWFFKLSGPKDAVAKQATAFSKFLQTVKFTDADSPPTWSLAEGWTQEPGSGMRFAMIHVDVGPPALDMSVTHFQPETLEGAVLSNVNRWRGQMGMPPITAGQLPEQTKSLKIGGETATTVDLVGKMSAAPFAGGAMPPGHPDIGPDGSPSDAAPNGAPLPPGHPAIPESASDSSSPSESPDSSPGITYETPSGWQPGKMSAMRKAAFVVEDGSQNVEITVVALPSFAGDMLRNVNRWRRLLHLPDIEPKDLDAAVKPISIGSVKGSFVDITGAADPAPQKSILGAMASAGGQVWFFKLEGNTKLAEREKSKFESFLKSVKFQ